ncbi:hypothetical protein QPK32_17665 [Massilia sp. YIM B02763]|uniref:hypothetical protein n=1 Tax=Massilia sp. YIM B02763 TaxID=3050130 RepID=UPI0025B6C2A0|nr:hypothetical protein [Massilia sp. YIM B02763]MDN4054911.1 hypothetical protein [Massilia sp. YIM B02763]
MHERRVTKAYHRELFTALAVYVVLLSASIAFGRPLPEGPLRTAVLLLPMAGFGLMIRAIARHVRRIDEYQRLRMLETLGLAFAITGAVTFSYGFLETAGFPRLSMFSVWIVMGASWALASLARARVERRPEP